MKPDMATIASGRGRPTPRPSAYAITAPWENPPSQTLSCGSESSQTAASAYDGANVSGSGSPTT
jgi:hypothetical protein